MVDLPTSHRYATAHVSGTKVVASAAAAVADIARGASLAVGGFGLCGVPNTLITAILTGGADELEVVSNNCGVDGVGLGELLAAGRIRRIVASYVGENQDFARRYLAGDLEVELTPQGTLAERLRAGGAGIPAFFTPAGVGTPVAEGGLALRFAPDGTVAIATAAKETRVLGGRRYVLETALTTDFSLVHATCGDTDGNLVFNKSARNFNPVVAMAGRTCIAEVETLLPTGAIDPDRVHLPGIFVDRVVPVGLRPKHIEKRTISNSGGGPR